MNENTVENNIMRVITRVQMDNVLDELMTISRCDMCGCVNGIKPWEFNNTIENSDNCNYNIKPSYMHFNHYNEDVPCYCSTACWVHSVRGMFVGHLPYDRTTKLFCTPVEQYY